MSIIRNNVARILSELPDGVTLCAAAKTRKTVEILEAIEAGVKVIGHNYIQEAERTAPDLEGKADLHCIGHIQRNKAARAVTTCDLIETVDSLKIARVLDMQCSKQDKHIPIYLEVNIAREKEKTGFLPEELESAFDQISRLNNLRIEGLMTMGPWCEDAEMLRPFFRETRKLFEILKNRSDVSRPGIFRTLSMGMSNSYHIAIDEGATLIRLGTVLFGPRKR